MIHFPHNELNDVNDDTERLAETIKWRFEDLGI
jgi:hypothetical protein